MAAHYCRSGSRSIWPRGHHSPFMRLFCFFPRPHVRLVWEPLRILWGPIATAEELTQSSKGAHHHARVGRRSDRKPGNPRFPCGVHLVRELLSAMADPPNYPGASGSTAYSFRKCRNYLQRTAREIPRHTPPSHRNRVWLHSEKCARKRVVTSSRAASDDAVHAALVLRREAAGCWCTYANGRGRHSIDDEATSAALRRHFDVGWSGTARDLRQITGLTGFVGTGNDYA